MYRQSPSRNPRSKGIKVKHVLQICLLLAVCFWLIYQVKHSHDERKEFNESDGKGLSEQESGDDLIKLGRKGIQARLEDTFSKNERIEEPKDKIEDEIEDKKVEEMEGGDDEIDDVDREEDLVDEEKEREGGVENDAQETESEDVSVEGDDGSVNEAREEHYKADDVSSAVTHDARTENENEHSEKSKENLRNILDEEKKENKSDVPENVSSSNNTVAKGFDAHSVLDESEKNHDSSSQNVTKLELGQNPEILTNDTSSGSNSTISTEQKDGDVHSEEMSNSSNNTEASASEKKHKSEASMEGGTEGSLSKNDGTDDIVGSTLSENHVDGQHDAIDVSDTSNSSEENDVHTDLDTLSELQSEGTNSKDVAAE